MMASALENAEVGTFETHYNHLGGGYIIATVANNQEILGLCWCLIGKWFLLWTMENADKTVEHLNMTAVKEGDYTDAVHVID